MLLWQYFITLIGLAHWIANGKTVTHGKSVSAHQDGDCQVWYDYMKCTANQSVLLRIGHCMTHKEGEGTYAMECPYFQLKGHELAGEQGYIKLPNNISELNDYMCGPMNRQGLLCKDCVGGFGPSVTSIGYQCTNCTGVWYGVPSYLVQQLVPITLFYLIILIFRIHLASAPMTCFIMYSQLRGIEVIFAPMSEIVCRPAFKINAAFYGIWNLDFFQYILPPFCVSRHLQLSHIILLNYVSSIYPMVLIILTWILVQLRDHNVRLLMWLWKPFHHCLVKLRRGWETRRDLVDVFASFFLLSFSKIAYQSMLILQCPLITRLDEEGNVTIQHAMGFDPSIICSAKNVTYILIATLAGLSVLVCNIFPALLLVFYPLRAFRVCLSKLRLDKLVLTTFVEKFHGCYRNGLNGGRDMRSFAGLYLFLRFIPFVFRINKYTVHGVGWSYLVLLFLTVTILIALVRPYRRMYMNLFDTFLLADLTYICHLYTKNYFRGQAVQIVVLTNIPVFLLGCLVLYEVGVRLNAKQRLTNIWLCLSCQKQCCKEYCVFRRHHAVTSDNSESIAVECSEGQTRPLLPPTSVTVDIKSYTST